MNAWKKGWKEMKGECEKEVNGWRKKHNKD